MVGEDDVAPAAIDDLEADQERFFEVSLDMLCFATSTGTSGD